MNLIKIGLFICTIALTGCASLIVSPVSDSDRDTENTYDGKWRMTTLPLDSIQTVGKTRFRCEFGKRVAILRVRDGVANVNGRDSKILTNVSSDGKFRLEIPTDRKFTRSNGINEIKNGLTVIYQGILSDGEKSGLYILGKESLNNSGCSTRMIFEKL